MRIAVEQDRCIGSGLCALAAHEVFDHDDDGLVVVVTEYPPPPLQPAVHEAVRACPSAAIRVEEC